MTISFWVFMALVIAMLFQLWTMWRLWRRFETFRHLANRQFDLIKGSLERLGKDLDAVLLEESKKHQ